MIERSKLKKLLKEFPACRVLVVGDLILDRYVWGEVDRISPEAPVQVVEVDREDMRIGGAGNVVNNLTSLGCRVSLASVVGDDNDGEMLLEMLRSKGSDIESVLVEAGRKTSCKTRVLANRQQMLRIDHETTTLIDRHIEQRLSDTLAELLPQVDAVVVSDYLKGVLTQGLLATLIRSCRKASIPVIVDPKGNDYSRYNGATALTPNRRESEVATGISIVDEQSLIAAGNKMMQDHNLDALVLTRSEEGVSLFQADSEVAHFPTEAREVFDVSGAGDTVIATVAASLAAGMSFAEAVQVSNVAAGIVVAKLGTSTVTPDEMLAQCRPETISRQKILSPSQVEQALIGFRGQSKKVVFTNGCFDLLHAGHVKYLQKARQLGDLLVLGLNSDASIRRLKGEKRPLLEESERADILAALECIDYLVVFDEDTPIELIQKVRPDILAKGGDYEAHEVVGKDFVESYGGRVELVSFVEGRSTTNIINSILSRYRDDV